MNQIQQIEGTAQANQTIPLSRNAMKRFERELQLRRRSKPWLMLASGVSLLFMLISLWRKRWKSASFFAQSARLLLGENSKGNMQLELKKLFEKIR